MRKFLLILAAIVCLGLAGCAGAGSKVSPEVTTEKFGPLPENWQQLVMACISNSLIDPGSAQYRFGNAQPRSNGWYGGLYVNAKNRFGGYVGDTLYEWLIENGEVTSCSQHVFAKIIRGR